jgi:hypothetical protein
MNTTRFNCILILTTILSIIANMATAQTVALDYYFNHETRLNKSKQPERFHYTWEDTTSSGFSKWGEAFKVNGAKLISLNKPTLQNLKTADVYIIVDPDNNKENPAPVFIMPEDVKAITDWVKAGGVLVIMANDSANTELRHFNLLANSFGFHFNNDMQSHVTDDAHFEDGTVTPPDNTVFKTASKIFIKDACSISMPANAKALLRAKSGAVIAAAVKKGKGHVIAIGDPWLYNEYVNGRLPASFENDKAMSDLSKYLLALSSKK